MARLKRTNRGSVILPNGERITLSEQKALRSAVNSANRKRKELINKLPKEAMRRYKDFGIESDWVLRKKSTALNRFRSKKEFNKYLRHVRKLTNRQYIDNITSTYRANFIRAINNTFNSSGSELIEFINSLSNKDLRELSLADELGDIGYVYYDPKAPSVKLERLKKQMAAIKKKRKYV